jgi:hypothetical protein
MSPAGSSPPFKPTSLGYQSGPLDKRFPQPDTLVFRPIEPNVELTFTMKPTGHIRGVYALRPEFAEPDSLSGAFEIDQSHLPGLVSVIWEFVRHATNSA